MKKFSFILPLLAAVVSATAAEPAKQISENKTAEKTPVKTVKKIKTVKKQNKNKHSTAPAKVNISSFTAAEDTTAALRMAIKSGAKQIIFDRAGIYELRPVALRKNLELIFTDGVIIKGQPPAEKEVKLPGLFSGKNIRNIKIHATGDAKIYGSAELPIFHFTNTSQLLLNNITLLDGKSAVIAKNVWGAQFNRLVIDNFTGDAVSISGGGWNNIIDTQFRNINGTGLIITALPTGFLAGFKLDNCEFFNSNSGFKLLKPEKTVPAPPQTADKSKKPRNISANIRSCRFFNNTGLDAEVDGTVSFGTLNINNTVFNNTKNSSLVLRNFTNQDEKLKLVIGDCEFRPGDHNANTPVIISSDQPFPVGNITISGTKVKQPVHKKAVSFNLKNAAGKLNGVLPVIAPDGSRINAKISMEDK